MKKQQTKKNPAFEGPGQEAFLLSHTKAPAQGGKAGSRPEGQPGAMLQQKSVFRRETCQI
ncbi:hypothetical protein [Hydrogenophaga sp. PAMC20947]|uniref:hypothetical protein n=1 Tax=Hydrogenophaga sp. PAMC20947 TaxID=2565558 RepID=UPI00109DD2CB|nr:hypothetical protein [Hydrogenophaga sp. PAMC20947]QCB47401.1 hypothetical protein E5678_16050 [Hydrogenophaga sp. PAMC20947]